MSMMRGSVIPQCSAVIAGGLQGGDCPQSFHRLIHILAYPRAAAEKGRMAELLKLVGEGEGAARELPRNIEAEGALLGALLIDNRVAEDIQLRLKPEHFFEPVHGRIYEAILKLLDKNMVASPVTLKPMLDHDPALKELGGSAYLVQ